MTCCGGNCHTKDRLQRKAANLLRYANEDKLREVVALLERPLAETQPVTLATAAPDTLNSAC